MASKIPALLRPVAFAACPRVKSGMFGIVRFCFFLAVYLFGVLVKAQGVIYNLPP
jgi:hypothetical protein